MAQQVCSALDCGVKVLCVSLLPCARERAPKYFTCCVVLLCVLCACWAVYECVCVFGVNRQRHEARKLGLVVRRGVQ